MLAERFALHPERHAGVPWHEVAKRLQPQHQKALAWMEATGGEPDVIGIDAASGEFLIADCSPESPTGRRSLCYDGEALAARKLNKPEGSAVAQAQALGLGLLTEAQYLALQALGEFDLKTSSWLATPDDIRRRGGALFGDRRFGRVFVYHNGAESYYAARGYRALLRV